MRATYNDLGATVTGPQADLNLGIDASVDGGATTTQDQITVDTSQPGEHIVLYCTTDQSGLTACATRTVIIQAPAADECRLIHRDIKPILTNRRPTAQFRRDLPVSCPKSVTHLLPPRCPKFNAFPSNIRDGAGGETVHFP